MRRIILIILFFPILSSLAWSAAPVRVGDGVRQKPLTSILDMLEDPSGAMTIDQASKSGLAWKKNKGAYFNAGYSKSAYWFRMVFENPGPKSARMFLEIDFPTLDHVDLYVPDEEGGFHFLKGGDSVPFSQRNVKHRNHVFSMDLQQGSHTCYLRIQSEGAIEFHVNLLSGPGLVSASVRENSLIWLIYGCIIMAGLYNLSVFSITRDKNFLFLVFYGLTFLLVELAHKGFISHFFCSETGRIGDLVIIIALALNLSLSALFTTSFLGTQKKHPVIHRIIFWTMMVPGLVYIVAGPWAGFANIIQLLILHGMAACVLIFVFLIYLSFKRNRQAVFLTAGYCFILVSGVLSVLTFMGILPPGAASKWVLPVSAAWLMLTFSIGLADKVNVMKQRLELSETKIRHKNVELVEANDALHTFNKTIQDRNTELTVLHEELEVSEHRFRSMIEQSPMVIELYDPKGNLLQTNKVQKDTWGAYGPVAGAEFNILASPAMRKLPIFPSIQKVFKGEGGFLEEWSLRGGEDGPEDGERYYRSRIYPICTATGKLSNVVIMHEDVTKDRRSEEILIQSEKMVSLGALAAGMAHEINSPLAGVVQNAQVLIQRLTKPMAANEKAAQKIGFNLDSLFAYMEAREIPRILDSIREEGMRVAKTVRNMLSFSRQSGSEADVYDLRALMRETVDMARSDYDLKKRFNFRNMEVREHFSPEAAEVYCEPGQIQQVFLNILKNGAQAMAGANTDPAQKPRFDIRIFPKGDRVVVEIQDNGPGIPSHVLEHIFDPFYTTKRKGEGTGLGLYLCTHIIRELHNGSIWVESEPGQGALFHISLPVEGPPAVPI
ncbi:Histidine kinase [Desulfatibacillum aliphaticivorans]|uniref:histidine kinase n=1 Tax=Desulfatibacillum aliphaticivorans TaxID=218208 RepID=B8FAN8_DESAL|nr:7TM-DISM domain-containing protein [Desulfatibacillum aliphaticivorans]ACL03334.1 Histidine kinase [Desulfatibacillum aliphaticivorans]